MIEITKPADRGNGQTGFVVVSGGVMNCLNDTTSLNDNQAKYSYESTITAPPIKVSKLLIAVLCLFEPFVLLQFLCLVAAVVGAVFL